MAIMGFGLVASFLAIATVLLLSDRAGRWGEPSKRFILDVGEAFESTFGVDWIDRNSVPGTFDQIGHALLWGGGMLVLGLALRRWMSPIIIAFFLLGSSILFELLQSAVTEARTLSPSDAVANAVGIVIAAVVVLVVGLLLDFFIFPLRNWLRSDTGARRRAPRTY